MKVVGFLSFLHAELRKENVELLLSYWFFHEPICYTGICNFLFRFIHVLIAKKVEISGPKVSNKNLSATLIKRNEKRWELNTTKTNEPRRRGKGRAAIKGKHI